MMSEEEGLIDDQYQFVMGIATGSSSQVNEVVEKSSSRHLAMKILKKDVPEFKANKAQLRRESEVLKSLDHPQIVKFEKFSSNRDHTYMLMEHFRASNLKIQIKNESNKVHMQVRSLLEGVCSALSHVHQKGYIHRDIKPDNILLNRAGEVRLCDFSLSSKQKKGFGKMLAGKLKSIQGTRTYIAPETIRRLQPTIQTDLYSLGVLFYEVLTGRTPFQAPTPEELLHKHLKAEAPNPSEYNPNVSPEMDRIVAKLLKKKPADRPASVDEVLGELKRIRIFKEDVIDEAVTKKANEDAEFMAMVSEARLDSRADAKLKKLLATDADFAKKYLSERQETNVKKKAENERQRKRIEAAEDAQAKKAALKKPPAAAAKAPAAPPQPMQMPMQMPGYPPGYPQGYAMYPQAPMPMMPLSMPPGTIPPAPGVPQYPGQPQAMYQQPAQQAPAPPAPNSQPAPPPARNPAPATAAPPAPGPQAAVQKPQPAPSKPQPPSKSAARSPQPPPQPPPARQTPPAAPARVLPSPIARPVARATPATAENADLEFMTDLPDVS